MIKTVEVKRVYKNNVIAYYDKEDNKEKCAAYEEGLDINVGDTVEIFIDKDAELNYKGFSAVLLKKLQVKKEETKRKLEDKIKNMAEVTNEIKEKLQNTIKERGLNWKVTTENFNKCLLISSESDESLRIWIRLLICKEDYIVDFSSVELPVEQRRKGNFTAIYNAVESCEHVSKIRITSVVTDEMYNWCKSHGLKNSYIYDWEN